MAPALSKGDQAIIERMIHHEITERLNEYRRESRAMTIGLLCGLGIPVAIIAIFEFSVWVGG